MSTVLDLLRMAPVNGSPTVRNIATAIGALLWRADINPIVGGATILKASEKVAATSADAIPFVADDFSIQIKVNPGASHSATIYSYIDGSDYLLVQIVSNRLYVDMKADGVSAAGYVSAAALTSGTWYDIVLNCDRSGVLTCYLNAVAQSANTLDISGLSASFTNSSPTQLIGATSAGVGHLTANLEYLRVRVGSVLSTSEISWLHNGGNGRTSADLALIGDEQYMDVDFSRPGTSLADYPPIDRSGNTDWIFVASNMLANPGFETLTGWTGKNFVATQKASYDLATNPDPETSDFYVRLSYSGTGASQGIFSTGGTGASGFAVYLNSSGYVYLYFTTGVVGVLSDAAVNDGLRHDIAINFDRDGNATCYVDGNIQTATLDISGASASLGATTGVIGSLTGSTYYLDGKLGLVKYGLGLLTAADIAAGNVPASAATYENATPVHAWDMNDRTSTGTIVDSEGGNTGTATFGNMVVNGTFDTDTGWMKDASWTIAGGVASYDGSVTDIIHQSCGLISGDTYAVTGDVTNYTGTGALGLAFESGTRTDTYLLYGNGSINATLVSNGGDITFFGTDTNTHDLDNVAVKATKIRTISDADLFANWTESTSGTSRIHAETVDVDAGTYSARMDIGADNGFASFLQAIAVIGNSYDVSARSVAASGSPTFAFTSNANTLSKTATTSWATYSGSIVADATTIGIKRSVAVSNSLYFDTVSCLAATVGIANGSAVSSVMDSGPLGNDGVLSGMGIDAFSTDVADTDDTNGGLSLLFDGMDDAVTLASDPIGTGDVTVSAWINPAGWGEASAWRLFENGSTLLYTTSVGRLYLNAAFSVSGSIVLDTWQHVAVTRTSTGVVNFYINGTLSGTANQPTGTPAAATTAATIGNRAAGDRTFDGNLDNFRVDTGILTTAQIAALAAGDSSDPNYPPDSGIKVLIGFEDFNMGLPNDNTPVLAWTTYGTARATVRQTEPTTRPTFRSTGIGGRACLEFDGIDDELYDEAPATLVASSDGDWWLTISPADLTGDHAYISLSDADGTHCIKLGTADTALFVESVAATTKRLTGTTTLVVGTTYRVHIYFDGTDLVCEINEATETMTGDTPDWIDDLTGIDTLAFGAVLTDSTVEDYVEGMIADIILSPIQATDEQRADIALAIKKRYPS